MWVSGRKFSVVGDSGPEGRASVPVSATPPSAADTPTGSSPALGPVVTVSVGRRSQGTARRSG